MNKFNEKFIFSNGIELESRIILAPMSISSATTDGEITQDIINFYKSRSENVGAIIIPALVSESGAIANNEIRLTNNRHIKGLMHLIKSIKSVSNSKIIIQLYHAGRLANSNLTPNNKVLGPSPISPSRNENIKPIEMSNDEINHVVLDFKNATERAIKSGADGIEIHACNGFLIQQFLSPASNIRNDKWGGNFENRTRLLKTIMESVNRVIKPQKNFLIGVRISPEEPSENGLKLKDTLQLTNLLLNHSISYINVSVDDFWKGSYQIKDINKSRVLEIFKHIDNRIPVLAGGNLLTPNDVEHALSTGVPLITLGHAIIMNPQWIYKANNNPDEIKKNINIKDQYKLEIPENLWSLIMNIKGWFVIDNN